MKALIVPPIPDMETEYLPERLDEAHMIKHLNFFLVEVRNNGVYATRTRERVALPSGTHLFHRVKGVRLACS